MLTQTKEYAQTTLNESKYQNKYFTMKILYRNLEVCRYAKYPGFELKTIMYLNLYYMVMIPANKKDKNLDSIILTSN